MAEYRSGTMGDRVFIADYIKKKRKRRGSSQYLVKWKGYSVRHCTWEPEENILDLALIKEFSIDGYDPRRRRLRAKKRRRSEVTESRPLSTSFGYGSPDRDSDGSDQSDSRQPHDYAIDNDKGLPIDASSDYKTWQPDVARSCDESLLLHSFGSTFQQRDVSRADKDRLNETTNVNNQYQVQTKDKARQENGGKICHPKMRAKLMFKTGDFADVDWGYDWSPSPTDGGNFKDYKTSENDTESDKTDSETHTDYLLTAEPQETDLKRSASSDSVCTIPAIEEEYCPKTKCMKWETEETGVDDAATGAVRITKITHDCVTVTFMESPTQKGFFRDRCTAQC